MSTAVAGQQRGVLVMRKDRTVGGVRYERKPLHIRTLMDHKSSTRPRSVKDAGTSISERVVERQPLMWRGGVAQSGRLRFGE